MLTRKVNEYEGQHRVVDDEGDAVEGGPSPESSAAERADRKAEKAKVVVEGE